ncbi:MAG TPA: DUF3106 domain-containing protein [Candidatus Eisenbacteria bacterium]|nr:DUF3106 domain-containing protein [Candidatus Eisenbacteria bacterium]
MRCRKLQFGWRTLAALALLGVPALPAGQQREHPDRPPHAGEHSHRQTNANHPPRNASPSPHPNANSTPEANRPNGPRAGSEANYASPRRSLGVGAPRPWVDQMRELTPQQRDRVFQNSRAFQNLSPDKQARIRQQFNQWDRMSPSQQAKLRENEATWRRLTPEQREHIKNDILPKWRQMPWDRQQIIKQKLGILQNMPEYARNQRLSDPNFTRGMTDEERSVLDDLSHTHVGAPDNPSE